MLVVILFSQNNNEAFCVFIRCMLLLCVSITVRNSCDQCTFQASNHFYSIFCSISDIDPVLDYIAI
uniref:Uncharacterized protein n=1 Tax=Manihot esculenta TaxID=3983 RepID=A0A2C9V1N3_MANES